LIIPEIVTIDSLGNNVGGIARQEGYPAIFVKGALPGETVKIRPLKEKKNFITAELVSVETPSKHRVKPFCKYYGKCGGCSLQHLDYNEQLKWKRAWIEKALRNLEIPEIEQTIPSPATTGYRNRVTFDVHNQQLTLHAFKGDPIPVAECPLMNETSKKALRFFQENNFLDEALTKVSFRGADNTEDGLIELSGKFTKAISANWPQVAQRAKIVWLQLNKGQMIEKLGKYLFHVQPGGFFQVNTRAGEKLIELVLKYNNEPGKKVLDLFGGVGSFGIPLAAEGFRVTSVELDWKTSKGCTEAITINNIDPNNLRVITARDSSFLSKVIKKKISFDTIITDPPRAGMGIRTAKQITRLKAKKIIYVSCNPFSAARDLAVLVEGGYSIKQITPIDMFPHTDHIEAVFYLERGV